MTYRSLAAGLLGSLALASATAACDDGDPGTGGAGATTSSSSAKSGATTTTSTTGMASATTTVSGSSSSGMAANPHPLYPALDLDTLPGPGGGASGAYEPPMLPVTTNTVTVAGSGAAARAALQAACQMPGGTAVTVPDTAGNLGVLDLGNVDDCDITLGPAVVVTNLFLGHLPGPTQAPIHRVRVRGGQIGNVVVDPNSSDIVLDGVVLNNAVVPPAQRGPNAIYLTSDANVVNRFAVVNSIIRMVATLPDGSGNTDGNAYLASNARNVFFANDNIVTAGNRNAWGFRISGGENTLIVDCTVRVSFHKLVRMNDGPVDYVYVKGGTWMREATLTAGGAELNDAFTQLEDHGTDHVFIHGPAVHLLSAQPVSFGASFGPGQNGKSWEARNIAWFARNASVVSDATLTSQQNGCVAGASCDYGIGTHSYAYDANLAFPANPWRDLPTIAVDDPDDQPIQP